MSINFSVLPHVSPEGSLNGLNTDCVRVFALMSQNIINIVDHLLTRPQIKGLGRLDDEQTIRSRNQHVGCRRNVYGFHLSGFHVSSLTRYKLHKTISPVQLVKYH